jgi:hypothetical protein
MGAGAIWPLLLAEILPTLTPTLGEIVEPGLILSGFSERIFRKITLGRKTAGPFQPCPCSLKIEYLFFVNSTYKFIPSAKPNDYRLLDERENNDQSRQSVFSAVW